MPLPDHGLEAKSVKTDSVTRAISNMPLVDLDDAFSTKLIFQSPIFKSNVRVTKFEVWISQAKLLTP